MKRCIEKAGGRIFIISRTESIERINKIDGLIIPGGRDINPKYYN